MAGRAVLLLEQLVLVGGAAVRVVDRRVPWLRLRLRRHRAREARPAAVNVGLRTGWLSALPSEWLWRRVRRWRRRSRRRMEEGGGGQGRWRTSSPLSMPSSQNPHGQTKRLPDGEFHSITSGSCKTQLTLTNRIAACGNRNRLRVKIAQRPPAYRAPPGRPRRSPRSSACPPANPPAWRHRKCWLWSGCRGRCVTRGLRAQPGWCQHAGVEMAEIGGRGNSGVERTSSRRSSHSALPAVSQSYITRN